MSEQYMGQTIELPTPANGYKFRVRTEDDPGAFEDHPSMAEARLSIETAARSRIVLALEAVDENGERSTITGINRGNGYFNGPPSDSRYRTFHAAHPAAIALTGQRAALRKELDRIEAALVPYRLHGTRGRMSPAAHLAALEKLQTEYERIMALPVPDPEPAPPAVF